MAMLKIYYGAKNPIRVIGKNACALVSFAEKYKGWHSIGKTRADRDALKVALKAGCIEVSGDMFRFIYPR